MIDTTLSDNWSQFKKLYKGLELFHRKFADRPKIGVVNGVMFVDIPDTLNDFDAEYLNTIGWLIYGTRATFGLVEYERTREA